MIKYNYTIEKTDKLNSANDTTFLPNTNFNKCEELGYYIKVGIKYKCNVGSCKQIQSFKESLAPLLKHWQTPAHFDLLNSFSRTTLPVTNDKKFDFEVNPCDGENEAYCSHCQEKFLF
jgi:hypothetical protein